MVKRYEEEKVKNESKVKSFSDLWKVIKSNYLFLILIFVFTFAIYGNSIGGDFVNLDNLSDTLREQNSFDITKPLREFNLVGVHLSLILKLFGENPHAFHFFTILNHAINGCLVFLLAYIIFGKKASIMTTLMFLSHPANTESVSWHAGFVYPLRAIAMISVLILFSLFKTSGKKKYLYATSALLFISLGVMRLQGWLFITPFLIVLLDQYIFEDKIKFKNIKHYIPIIIVSLIFAATLLPGFFKQRLSDLTTLYYVKEGQETPLVNRIPYIIYMEYKTLAIPYTLSIYHEGSYISNLEYALMITVTIAVVYLIFYLLKKDRRISGLMMMIIFSILPSFSPRIIAWTAAERYLYMPTIFSSMIVSLILIKIEDKINRDRAKENNHKTSKFALYAAATIILLFSIRTIVRNIDYRNSKNLWIATRKTAPYSYRVYNNMGDVYADEKNYELAIENFKKSVLLRPDYADAVHNIGHIYMVLGQLDRAKYYLGKSLEMNPRLYMAAFKLGSIAMYEGKPQLAKGYFEKCLQYQPSDPDCIRGLNSANASPQP